MFIIRHIAKYDDINFMILEVLFSTFPLAISIIRKDITKFISVKYTFVYVITIMVIMGGNKNKYER